MKFEDGKKLKTIIKKEKNIYLKRLYITINLSMMLLLIITFTTIVLRIYIYEWPVLKPGEIKPGYEYFEQEISNTRNRVTNDESGYLDR